MKINLFLLALMLISTVLFAYPQIPGTGSSVPGTSLTASSDVVSASTDTHNVGVSTNVWKGGYFKSIKLKADVAPTAESGFGGLYVSSADNELYYQNASTGVSTKVS